MLDETSKIETEITLDFNYILWVKHVVKSSSFFLSSDYFQSHSVISLKHHYGWYFRSPILFSCTYFLTMDNSFHIHWYGHLLFLLYLLLWKARIRCIFSSSPWLFLKHGCNKRRPTKLRCDHTMTYQNLLSSNMRKHP